MPSSPDDVLVVTIEPDTSRFDAAISEARARIQEHIAAFARLYAAAYPIYLRRQRHRSRVITRRKQRRRW